MGDTNYDNSNLIESDKTFTLDEVITIINSIPPEMNVNLGGISEFTKKELIDKKTIIEKFKSI